eukprot:363363-Chlamydomonas_euryale.AAC.1
MRVGETLMMRGPKGRLQYVPNMKKHIGMLAGGTGITPMYQVWGVEFVHVCACGGGGGECKSMCKSMRSLRKIEWMDGWMDGRMDGWMDGRTDGRSGMDAWMDGWVACVPRRADEILGIARSTGATPQHQACSMASASQNMSGGECCGGASRRGAVADSQDHNCPGECCGGASRRGAVADSQDHMYPGARMHGVGATK